MVPRHSTLLWHRALFLLSFLALALSPVIAAAAAAAAPAAGIEHARSKLLDAGVVTLDDLAVHRISERTDSGEGNYFTNPPIWFEQSNYHDDQLYHVGDTLNITWETAWPAVDVVLCQPALDGTYGQTTLKANSSDFHYAWTVTESDVVVPSGPVGNVFFLLIHPSGTPIPLFQSHYFNVTEPAAGEQPVIITSPGYTSPLISSHNASSPTTAKNGSSTSLSASTSTSQSSDTTDASVSISGGAVAGICIAIVFVSGAIAAVLTWFLCVVKRRRRIERERELAKAAKMTDSARSSMLYEGGPGPRDWVLAEAPADESPTEIGSAPMAHEVETREAPVELPAWGIGEAREMREREEMMEVEVEKKKMLQEDEMEKDVEKDMEKDMDDEEEKVKEMEAEKK